MTYLLAAVHCGAFPAPVGVEIRISSFVNGKMATLKPSMFQLAEKKFCSQLIGSGVRNKLTCHVLCLAKIQKMSREPRNKGIESKAQDTLKCCLVSFQTLAVCGVAVGGKV